MHTARIRRIGIAAVAALSVFTLAACSNAPAAEYDPDEEITLNFTWWGNEDRASRYQQLMDKFTEQHPNIKIEGTFTDFASYYEKRATEAASGGLPDVMQFIDSYIGQYSENGQLLDLNTMSDYIDFSTFDDLMLSMGRVGDKQLALPGGFNVWSMSSNKALLAEYGLDEYEGGTSWEDYSAYMASVTEATDGALYGGTDYTQRIQDFEVWLRQQGQELYEDGALGFTEDDLREFWQLGAADRDGVTAPQNRLEEVAPQTGVAAKMTATELAWSNAMVNYQAESGSEEFSLIAPPTSDPNAKDLYRQGGNQFAIAATTKHPEAAAMFVDYLVNSADAGAVFGTSTGFPASTSRLAGTKLEGADLKVSQYLDSVADRIGPTPPIQNVPYGALEAVFWDLGKSIGLGAISIDDAVQQFFDEAAVSLD